MTFDLNLPISEINLIDLTISQAKLKTNKDDNHLIFHPRLFKVPLLLHFLRGTVSMRKKKMHQIWIASILKRGTMKMISRRLEKDIAEVLLLPVRIKIPLSQFR